MQRSLLMVLHEMGTLDHAVAVASQVRRSGWVAKHVILGENTLPAWALGEFPIENLLTVNAALEGLGTFAAAWLQEPYEKRRPLEWRNLWTRIRVVYSGYTLPLSDWREGLYELPFFDSCALILASGPYDLREHRRASGGSRKVIASGDPLMFEVSKLRDVRSANQGINTVLWAPHWSVKWGGWPHGFATWEWVIGELYRFFKSRPNIQLVVRPHPHLSFRDGNLAARFYAQKLFSLRNVRKSRSSLFTDIDEASVLVSDGVAILGYFAVTGKPVVVVESQKVPAPFGPLGREIVSHMNKVGTREQLREKLAELCVESEGAPMGTWDLSGLITEHFFVNDVSPGQSLVDNL